jgi:hypothetical protein
MTHPMARRLRITGMHQRVTHTSPIYRVTQCLRDGHTAEVPGSEIATTVSAWLAELDADSPWLTILPKRSAPATGRRSAPSATTSPLT